MQMMRDATTVRAFGLEVKLNDRSVRLQIDTGASGLVVSRAVAEHAHLTPVASDLLPGAGNKGNPAYNAYADSIVVGGLEFHDCQVHVVEGLAKFDEDGLIGTNVFSRFLVTLDFPMRKLALGELPRRPDDVVPAMPSLDTAGTQSDSPDSEKTGDTASRQAKDGKDSSAIASATTKVSRGPRDRYIDPQMEEWTKVYRVGQELLIPTLLNGTGPKLFMLNTAMFTTVISPTVARTLTKVSESRVRVIGLNGPVDKVYSADEIGFKFGNIRQKAHNVVSFESPQVSRQIGLEIAGSIGATELGRMTLSIDYRDGLVKMDYDARRGYRYPGLQ